MLLLMRVAPGTASRTEGPEGHRDAGLVADDPGERDRAFDRLSAEEPSDVVGVKVAANSVGDVGSTHAKGAQACWKLAAHTAHAVR